MASLAKNLGACLLFGMFVFAIAVFRETQVDDRPMKTALATGAIAGSVVCLVLAVAVYVLWRRERGEHSETPGEVANKPTQSNGEP